MGFDKAVASTVTPGAEQPAGARQAECPPAGGGVNHQADGTFAPGNQAAMTHGARRSLDRPELAPLITEVRQAVVQDLGGESELSTVALEVVESFARAAVLARCTFDTMLEQGPLTPRGKRRAIFSMWADLDEKVNRRAAQLGLQRKAKRVASLAEVMRA